MGGKQRELTEAEKYKRGTPIRRYNKMMYANYMLIGAIICGWLVVLFTDLSR